MIIINEPYQGAKTYIIFIGSDSFCTYANNEADVIEIIAQYFISRNASDWYFDAITIELMANCAHKSIENFVNDSDLRYCPKHNIYLPKLKIQEVSV